MSTAKEILLSLPPVDKMDFGSISSSCKSLKGYQASDLEAVQARQCSSSSSVKNATSPLAEALLSELQKQDDKHYGGGTSKITARHTVTDESGGALKINTYAELLEPHKSVAGYWSSEWIYRDSALSGTISMHVHYFEAGSNVQYRATRTIDPPQAADDAAAAVQVMVRCTSQLHNDLVQLSDDGLQTSLKKVRRILPITKTRMKWDDAAQEQVRLLNEKKGQDAHKGKTKKKLPGMGMKLPGM